MINKKSSNQSTSNFRQQENATRKLESDIHTAAQKQHSQTAKEVDGGSQNKGQGKLKKKYPDNKNHVDNEFRQQESTVSKIEKTLDTQEQQRFSQTTSVLHPSGGSSDNLKNQFSEKSSSESKDFQETNNKSKLQKRYSNQAREEFRQKDSTISKIEKPLSTQEQQITQSSSKFNRTSNDSSFNLSNSASGNESLSSAGSKITSNKSKLQKQFNGKARQEFQQKENPANKIDKISNNENQHQFSQTSKSDSGNINGSSERKFSKPKNNSTKRRFRLQSKELAKGALLTTGGTLKSGVEKYQNELENGDAEGVTLASQGITKTVRVSGNHVQKLRHKRLENKNFKKAKQNPLYKQDPKNSKEKVLLKKNSSIKKLASTPTVVLKNAVANGAMKYKGQLEQDDEGVKLASQGSSQIARASKKLTKGINKINAQSGKLAKPNRKLQQVKFSNSKKMKTDSKAVLKKKAFKKKMYAPRRNKKAFAGALSSFSNRMSDLVKGLGKFNVATMRKLVGAKVAAYFGSGLISVLPFIIVAAIVLILVGVMGGGGSNQQTEFSNARNLSADVEKWRTLVASEASLQGMEAYVGLVLAIIQVETGGAGTRDIMQSSESAGYPRNYWATEELSVRQGIKHLKSIVNMLTPYGLQNDHKLLAQAYNFGSAFAKYVGNLGGGYNLGIAERYSREVVAPSLGNTTGERYSYVNATSTRVGKTYLYRNGGNYLYGELVSEFLGGGGVGNITGDFRIVVDELERYIGWDYVWGGKNPSQGFDCSGFVSWGLKQIGIEIPSYAAAQYDLTVPIDPSEAQPGDLVFFKGTYGGPNHVSHVGFYIDPTTMLDSNGSGVGYHNFKDSYWSQHYAGIRRIVKK